MEQGLLSQPARLAGQSLLRLQSDERLTELARTGHEPAFAAIVQRYRSPLVRYCTRLLGPDRAEDAVQQALANAHAALTRPDDDRPINLRPWLYRVTHNAALNILRAGTGDTLPTPDEIAGGETPHEVLARREQLDELLTAISRLPAGQRDALLLRELEGRSHEEIADLLGVTRGAARQQLFRARAAIRTACTALTPAPLLARLLDLASSMPPPGGGSGTMLAGAVTKVTAAVLTVGAVAGGAASTGVIHRHDPPSASAAVVARADPAPKATRDVAATPADLRGGVGGVGASGGPGGSSPVGALFGDRSGRGRGGERRGGDERGGSEGRGDDGHGRRGNGFDDNGDSARDNSGRSGRGGDDSGDRGPAGNAARGLGRDDRGGHGDGSDASGGDADRGNSGPSGSGRSSSGRSGRSFRGSAAGDTSADSAGSGSSGSGSDDSGDSSDDSSGSDGSDPSGADGDRATSESGSSGSGSSG